MSATQKTLLTALLAIASAVSSLAFGSASNDSLLCLDAPASQVQEQQPHRLAAQLEAQAPRA